MMVSFVRCCDSHNDLVRPSFHHGVARCVASKEEVKVVNGFVNIQNLPITSSALALERTTLKIINILGAYQ